VRVVLSRLVTNHLGQHEHPAPGIPSAVANARSDSSNPTSTRGPSSVSDRGTGTPSGPDVASRGRRSTRSTATGTNTGPNITAIAIHRGSCARRIIHNPVTSPMTTQATMKITASVSSCQYGPLWRDNRYGPKTVPSRA
jgi:hypothetical protein